MNIRHFFVGRAVVLAILLVVGILVAAFYGLNAYIYQEKQADPADAPQEVPAVPERVSVVGYYECLPHKDTSGPQTMECAFGIAIDQSDGHYGINTALMSTYPVDYTTGTKVRVTGTLVPPEPSSKYDIDGTIWATTIERM